MRERDVWLDLVRGLSAILVMLGHLRGFIFVDFGELQSPIAGLGNLLFLQTIVVPVYGSNGPLWSLANEFWYYVLFPLLAVSAWTLANRERKVKPVTIQAILRRSRRGRDGICRRDVVAVRTKYK